MGFNSTHKPSETMKYLRNRRGEEACSLKGRQEKRDFCQWVATGIWLAFTYILSEFFCFTLVVPYLLVVTVEVCLRLT